jgi:hypothetical protein
VIPLRDRYYAAVCRNGHVVDDTILPPRPARPAGLYGYGNRNSSSLTADSPPLPEVPRHCGQCGAPVLEMCGSCKAPLLGAGKLGAGMISPMRRLDSFCWRCGEPYPWATREERVAKLYDLIDHEDLDEATLLTVREQIAVLSQPVDEATDDDRVRAGRRIRDLAPKAWEAVLPVLQGLLTAEAKRRLGLP